jgi:hypothetical protein
MTAALLALTIILVPSSASAGLCANCVGKPHIMNVGKCVGCGATTTSGSFSLCPACSAAQKKCEVCGAALSSVPTVVPLVKTPVVPPVEKPVVKPIYSNIWEGKPVVAAPVVKSIVSVNP